MLLNTPFGVFCLIVITITSLINIYAHWIDDGLFGRLLHMAVVLTCAAGFIRYIDSNIPYQIASTLIFLYMLKSVRNLCVRSVRYYKYRRTLLHAKSKHK